MRTITLIGILHSAIALTLCLCFGGCEKSTSPVENVMQSSVAAPTEKSEVELSDAHVEVTPEGLLKFKVKYTFTKGQPTLNYVCMLELPGTTNQGQKPLQNWELQKTGNILGTIELQSLEPPVKEFALTLGEAEVPQSGYETISNKLTGEVLHLEAKPE